MKSWTLVFMIMVNFGLGDCIKCFQCDTLGNPACGENFKSYQFPAENCPGSRYKCGLQRSKQKGDFIGILRACYELGSMALEDESDGCQEILFAGHTETSSFCLCSKDYCNNSYIVTSSFILMCFSACLSLWVTVFIAL